MFAFVYFVKKILQLVFILMSLWYLQLFVLFSGIPCVFLIYFVPFTTTAIAIRNRNDRVITPYIVGTALNPGPVCHWWYQEGYEKLL